MYLHRLSVVLCAQSFFFIICTCLLVLQASTNYKYMVYNKNKEVITLTISYKLKNKVIEPTFFFTITI